MKPRPLLTFGLPAICVLGTLMVFSAGARAQVPELGDQNKYDSARVVGEPADVRVTGSRVPEWGISSTSIVRLVGGDFSPTDSDGVSVLGNGWWAASSAPLFPFPFEGSIHLPSGAMITGFATEVYDGLDTGDVTVSIEVCPNLLGACTFTPEVSTSGKPSYTWLTSTLASPITIDNSTHSYFVRVTVGGALGNAFRSVIINYQLQVSPAPSTATFSDVPTGYWAFPYIEALAASGITVGCAPGTFCPEDPVTRAQMAVFLAKALGLHWPN